MPEKPRLEHFFIQINSGERGFQEEPKYIINGFKIPFENLQGGTGSGETLTAEAKPGSVPKILLLAGPDDVPWDIESIKITYRYCDTPPFTLTMGSVTLDTESDLNLLQERPQAVLTV